MNTLKIFKIGGNVVDNPQALSEFIKNFCQIAGNKIIVHGGGKEATRLAQSLGIETKMINGRRITDRETIDVVTMVYAGLVNKRVVSLLQMEGCNAIGLSGADGDAIRATRRPPVMIDSESVDFGFVGDINSSSVNSRFISTLLSSGLVPVFSAINHDGDGTLLNCNADGVASAIATAMADKFETELYYCFEQKGLLRNIDDPESVIPLIYPEELPDLLNKGIIFKGMIPKVESAVKAVKDGVKLVAIKHSSDILEPSGTIITQ